jgi:hypothetical protein
MSWHVSECPSFKWLNNTSLCYHFFCDLFICWWVCVLIPPWSLWNNAAVIIVCKYLFKTLVSILLDIYTETKLLDHRVIPFLFFLGEPLYGFEYQLPFSVPTHKSAQELQFLHILANTCFLVSIFFLMELSWWIWDRISLYILILFIWLLM